MGHIKKILNERPISKGVYNDEARLELHECIHFHFRDLRLFFDRDTFIEVSNMFAKARRKYDEMGQPDTLENMAALDTCQLNPSFIGTRLAIELQKNNLVHIHYNDLRIHVNLGDLMAWFEVFEHAYPNIPAEFIQELDLNAHKYHQVVDDHVEFLISHAAGEFRVQTPTDVKNRIFIDKFSLGDYFQRNFGLPKDWPNPTPQVLDYAYLVALDNAIMTNGYAPDGKYMIAFKLKDGSIQFVNSHRLAVLKALGYKKAKCFVVDAPNDWE